MENPYSPPKAEVADVGLVTRAKSPKVIGIIILILSGFGILGMAMNILLIFTGSAAMQEALQAQGLGETYYYVMLGMGILATLWLVYIGIQLVKYRDVGRKHFNYYLIYNLAITPLTTAYQWLVLPADTDISLLLPGLAGALLGLLFILLAWYYLNKASTKASLT